MMPCRQSSVRVRARAVAPDTSMIFKSHSPAWLVAGLPPAVNVEPRHPPQMTRLPQPLSRVVSADSALADWQQRLARETAMTAVVRRCLPRLLAERVHVRMPPGADPLITTDAGAVAAIVRQRLPDTRRRLAARRDQL